MIDLWLTNQPIRKPDLVFVFVSEFHCLAFIDDRTDDHHQLLVTQAKDNDEDFTCWVGSMATIIITLIGRHLFIRVTENFTSGVHFVGLPVK